MQRVQDSPIFLAGAALVVSEAIMALYPVVVRVSELPLHLQILSRMVSYALVARVALAARVGHDTSTGVGHDTSTGVGHDTSTGVGNVALRHWIAIGLISFAHVWVSYRGFALLDPGLAMAVFYMYPIFNVVLSAAVLGERTHVARVVAFLPAIAAIRVLSQNTHSSGSSGSIGSTNSTALGVYFMLMSAMTESVTYVYVRYFARELRAVQSSWNAVWFAYAGAAVISAVYASATATATGFRWSDAAIMTAWHVMSCATAQGLRFYALARLPAATFGALSFSGVIAAFAYGALFFGRALTPATVAAVLVVIVSGAVAV